MNDIQIKYFLALAQYLNFTTTANHLYVTQPAISKQIASLEDEVGTPLFFRTSHTVRLTPAGVIFRDAMLNIENLYLTARNDIAKISQKSIDRLIIGCPTGMRVSSFLDNPITAFNEKYPQIEIQLERHGYLELITELAEKKLDLILTLQDEVDRRLDFKFREILRVPAVIVMSKKHSFASLENITFRDFSEMTFFIPSADVSPFSMNFLIRTCAEFGGFEPKKIVQTPNVESVHMAVENGFGVTIADTLSRLCSDPSLGYLKFGLIRKIVVAWRKDDLNPFCPLIINQIIEYLKNQNVSEQQ